jgi:hypothetical protein
MGRNPEKGRGSVTAFRRAPILLGIFGLAVVGGVTQLNSPDTAQTEIQPTMPRLAPSLTGVAMSQLVKYNFDDGAKSIEAAVNRLTPQAAALVRSEYMLFAATGPNGLGQSRVYFAAFDRDPTTNEWRPMMAIDGFANPDESVQGEVVELPSGESYVGYVNAPQSGTVVYQTVDGSWEPLGSEGVAGFVPLPADAAVPVVLAAQ